MSLYNETLGEAIWPTPVMGIVGLLKTAPPVTIPFKEEGRTVLLLGGLGTIFGPATGALILIAFEEFV